MPPKKKKTGQSREELERLQREQEERQRIETLLRLEKEAEERQRQENELRDELEAKERKRIKKEAMQRLLAEKEATITTLSTELNALQSSYASERDELEDELKRMIQLRESLLNEVSALRSESESSQRKLLEDRAELAQALELERDGLQKLQKQLEKCQSALKMKEEEDEKRISELSKELNDVRQKKELSDHENTSRLKGIERELEKTSALNKTLQDVIEAREIDDRKNVTLMQLLNNQLDEQKRRSQEIIEEERTKLSACKHSLAQVESSLQQASEENVLLKSEIAELGKRAEAELHDNKAKVDQLKFDMKYLNSELHNYKTQLAKLQQETVTLKCDSAKDEQISKLAVESQVKKVEELEALLRRKDREHFDKVAFLNAQISNNRTIISQLQQKLNKERDERVSEVQSISTMLQEKSEFVQALGDDLDRRKTAATEIEMKLNADIAILKTTVFQLQSALVDRERQLDTITATKDEEIIRLRRKLDEHFIPHRNEIESSADGRPVEVVLNEKLAKLSHELDVSNRAALENETRLKAQISNQHHIIESLQIDLLRAKDEATEELKRLNAETMRLRQILDVNYIPYSK